MVIRKRSRFDRLILGFFVGAFVPLIVLLITYQVKFSDMLFAEWISNLWKMKILLKLMSLCVFPNLGFFMIFYRKNTIWQHAALLWQLSCMHLQCL